MPTFRDHALGSHQRLRRQHRLHHEPARTRIHHADGAQRQQRHGLHGIALALAAARDFPKLTIILMTGFADQRERASGLNAIVHDVVTKPFSVADIRKAVTEAVAAKR